MDLVDKLEKTFNTELTQRLLIRYFHERGYSRNFDRKVYPPMLQNLTEDIPELNGKIELIPHAIEIDPTNGFARIGWNLFILGNQRMYLGETEHTQLQELARQMADGYVMTEQESPIVSRNERTARDIVSYITRVLGSSDGGTIRKVDQVPQQRSNLAAGTGSSGYFRKPRAIRPEGSSQF